MKVQLSRGNKAKQERLFLDDCDMCFARVVRIDNVPHVELVIRTMAVRRLGKTDFRRLVLRMDIEAAEEIGVDILRHKRAETGEVKKP